MEELEWPHTGNKTRCEIIASGSPEIIKWAMNVRFGCRFLHGDFDRWTISQCGKILTDDAGNTYTTGEIRACFYGRQLPGYSWIFDQLANGQPVMPWIFKD